MMQMGIFRYIPDFGRNEANIAHHIHQNKQSNYTIHYSFIKTNKATTQYIIRSSKQTKQTLPISLHILPICLNYAKLASFSPS